MKIASGDGHDRYLLYALVEYTSPPRERVARFSRRHRECVARFSGRRTPPWHGHLARVEFHGLEARATRLPENLAAHYRGGY